MAAEGGGHGRAHALGALFFAPGEDGGAGARDRRAERARAEGGRLDAVEAGDERAALRLDDDVGEAGADEGDVVEEAAGEEAGEVGALGDEGAAVDGGREDAAGFAGVEAQVGVGEHAA